MTQTTTERGHHPDSPSSLQSSAQCAFFTNASRDSAASIAGTLQHKAAETRDLSTLDDEAQVAAVQRAIDLEDDVIKNLKDGGLEVEVIREQYLAVAPDESTAGWEGITGGYPDTLIIGRGEQGTLAAILDWKFGKQLVTPTSENLQGIAYALAVMQRWPEVLEVMVVFFHPHIEVAKRMEEYTQVFTRKDMPQMELVLRLVIERKKKAKADGWEGEIRPNPSTNLCIWCQHLATCPAVQKIATVVSKKYENVEVPAEVRPAYLTNPEDMRRVHQLAGVLEKFCKSVKTRIRDAVLTEGVEVPGMRLVTKADREIVSIAAVRDVALQHGVTVEQFENCLSLPLTKVEEVIKKAAPKGKGAATLREFQTALDDVGAVKKGNPYTYLTEDKSATEDAVDI